MNLTSAITALLAVCMSITQISATPLFKEKSKKEEKKKFIDPANMDLSVKPGDDFYTYASGTWIKNNPVPAKETSWGSFMELVDFNINEVKTILNKAATNKQASSGSIEKRVGDFYAASMDTIAIEKLGDSPIKTDLERINQIKNLDGILNEFAFMRTAGIASPLFSFYVEQDSKNPQVLISHLYQGGISLPDRDYYLKEDARNLKIREAFSEYITQLFSLIGYDKKAAAKNAVTIFQFEKQLAKSQLDRVEMRDPYKTYNKFAIADFSKTTPHINWQQMMQKMLVKGEDTLLVDHPSFFKTADSLLAVTPIEELKTYLKWNILRNAAANLSTPFVDARFKYTQVLSGQKEQTPRWQRMASLTDDIIGELLGQLYVKEHFKPEAKARMQELVSNLSKAFEIRIKALDWMSEATKVKALDKLKAFMPKIGYTDKWETYDGLAINRNTYFENLKNAGAWGYRKMVDKLGKPVDKTKWEMTPATVNAYYNPLMNEIVFPAGILQFPFFDPNADDAVNYGGIGAVIGHEMSHGFDDQGGQYDKDGSLNNWWTEEDLSKFKARAATLADQFNKYKVLDSIPVNGDFTLGENIGDLGGLNIAYTAFKMTKQGQSNTKIDGFTPDQRFFLSWAQVWRSNYLPETAAQLIVIDPHAPTEFRTIGPIVNMGEWYTAFDVKPGDKLYKAPAERIKIW